MNDAGFVRRYAGLAHRAYRRLGLGPQLAVFLLGSLSVTWALVGFELSHLHTLAQYESKQELGNLAHAFAEEVNSSVITIDMSLIGLRALWLRDPENFYTSVTTLQEFVGESIVFQVSIVDADGKLVFSSGDPGAKPIDLSDREHIRVHHGNRGDRLFISKPVLGRVSRQWSIQFTRPIYAGDGRYQGVIVGSVTPGYFSRFHQEMDLGAGASLTLIRAGGVIIARSPRQEEGIGMGVVMSGPQYQQAPPASKGFEQRVSPVDGVERFYAWRTLPRYGLVVTVGQSTHVISARYDSQRKVYLLGGAGISLLLAVAGYALLSAARQRAQAAAALAESEARWKFALEGAGDGVWDWNLQTNTVRLSERNQDSLRLEDEVLPGTPDTLRALLHPEDVEPALSALRTHLNGQTPAYVMEHRTRAPGGWVLVRGMVVGRSAQGQPLRMVGTYSDITERKAREALISHLARHDALTGLPNRMLFMDRLQQALGRATREQTRLAVIYFDLDGFKPVNDTYGHEVGDLLLKAVAARVRGVLRESDTVARIGGDEFVVLLPTISAQADAAMVAASVLDCLNAPFTVGERVLSISGSVGIATFPEDGSDEAELIRSADQAMYQAKAGGRNQIQARVP